MKYLAIHSLSVLLTLPAGPAGVAKEEHLQLLQNLSVPGWTASHYICTYTCLYICGLRLCSNLVCPFYLQVTVSGLLAECVLEKGYLCCYYSGHHLPWQLLRWRLGWKDMLLLLALVGTDGKSVVIFRMLCFIIFLDVRTVSASVQAWK